VKGLCLAVIYCVAWGLLSASTSAESVGDSIQGPATLNFPELLCLAVDESPPSAITEHLQRLLSEPFVSNEATVSGRRPIRPILSGLGPALRVAEWNIKQGLNEAEVELSLADPNRFEQNFR